MPMHNVPQIYRLSHSTVRLYPNKLYIPSPILERVVQNLPLLLVRIPVFLQ